jgi:multicomponent Na+:H+ antiporter subunit E
MTRRVALRITVLCWLVLVWILLWGRISAANVLSGLAVAVLVTVLLPLPVVPVQGRLHLLSLLRLLGYMGWELVLSSLQVAWFAIRPSPPPRSAVLPARLAVSSDLVLAFAVNALNMIPGTIVVEIDQDRRQLHVHTLDVGSDRAVERFYRQIARLERMLTAAFERDADWRPAAEERFG